MIRAFCKVFIASAVATAAMASVASASPAYNANLVDPGFYAGSGNPNSGFTVNTQNGVEIGLGVHYRFGASVAPSPTTGNVYIVKDGGQPCYSTTCALWNFDFSVNLQANGANPTLHLSDITSLMTITNVGTGDTFSLDPLHAFSDNYGWNGGPSDNTALTNLSSDWGFQNSENLGFFFPGFDPYAAGTYKIELSVAEGATSLGSVSETIEAVPSPGTLSLFAAGLGVLGMLGWRRKRKAVGAVAAL